MMKNIFCKKNCFKFSQSFVILFFSASLMLLKPVVALGKSYADLEDYSLLMSDDDEICNAVRSHMLGVKTGQLINVEPAPWVAVKPEEGSLIGGCGATVEVVVSDLNGDGVSEIVHKSTGCLSWMPVNSMHAYDWKAKSGERDRHWILSPGGYIGRSEKRGQLRKFSSYFYLDLYSVDTGVKHLSLLRIWEIPHLRGSEPYEIFAKIGKDYTLEDICYFSRNDGQ